MDDFDYDLGASAVLIDSADSARMTWTTRRADFARDEFKEEFPTLTKAAVKDAIVESEILGIEIKSSLKDALKLEEKEVSTSRGSKRFGLPVSKELAKDFKETSLKLASARKSRVELILQHIKKLQDISLCFMVDCTASMSEYMKAVKEKIGEIISSLKKQDIYVREVAFVCYRDHCDGPLQYEILPFVPATSLEKFEDFVESLKPTGGGDGPEDVLGGFNQVLKLKWNPSCGGRVLIHLCDAPAHGLRFTGPGAGDFYSSGHPSDRPLEELVAGLDQFGIYYAFGRIDSFTDVMIEEFDKLWHHPIDVFELKDPFILAEKVTTSVLESMSTLRARSTSKVSFAEELPIPLIKAEPKWEKLEVISGEITSIKIPDFADIVPDESELTSYKGFERIKKPGSIQIAPKPFAKGGERYAYYARQVNDESKDYDVPFYDMVIKIYKKPCSMINYERALEVQTIAEVLAQRFNKSIEESGGTFPGKIKFLKAKVVSYDRRAPAVGKAFCFIERRYKEAETGFMKLLSNDGSCSKNIPAIMKPFAELCETFAEFTYKVTNGYLMVTDLQGVLIKDKDGKNQLLLTDPAIHCEKSPIRFGRTNFGKVGFDWFAEKHTHNKYCKAELHKIHSEVVKREKREAEIKKKEEVKHEKYMAGKVKYVPSDADSMLKARMHYIEFCARCKFKTIEDCDHGRKCKFVHEGELCNHNVLGGDEACAHFRRSKAKIKKKKEKISSGTDKK